MPAHFSRLLFFLQVVCRITFNLQLCTNPCFFLLTYLVSLQATWCICKQMIYFRQIISNKIKLSPRSRSQSAFVFVLCNRRSQKNPHAVVTCVCMYLCHSPSMVCFEGNYLLNLLCKFSILYVMQYISNRCLMVSSNQAAPSCFYFRIS